MLVCMVEYILENKDYLCGIREIAKSRGMLIKVVGKNVVSVRRRGKSLIEIIRGNRSFRYFRMLIPAIRRDVRFFKRRKNGDIHFRTF